MNLYIMLLLLLILFVIYVISSDSENINPVSLSAKYLSKSFYLLNPISDLSWFTFFLNAPIVPCAVMFQNIWNTIISLAILSNQFGPPFFLSSITQVYHKTYSIVILPTLTKHMIIDVKFLIYRFLWIFQPCS